MDTQHSSNANSSLVATLESVDAEHNPFLYSVEKYVASHASQKLSLLPENSQARPNGTSVFQLPKLGYLCDMVLRFGMLYENTYVGGNNGNPSLVPNGRGLLSLIRRITWSNENREILSLTQDSMMALYSDLSLENRIAFSKAVKCNTDPLQNYKTSSAPPASNATDGFVMCELPIMLALTSKPSLFQNLAFLAPCQVKIEWVANFNEHFAVVFGANDAAGGAAPVVGGLAVPAGDITIEQSTVLLSCDFISLSQALASKSIEENYGSGSLSTLVWDMMEFPKVYQELPTDYTADFPIVDVPLQTAKCISDLYVMAYIPRSELRATAYSNAVDCRMATFAGLPLPIESISVTASGQNIVERVKASELRYWGRRTISGENGGYWATSGSTGGYRNRLSAAVSGATECPQAATYDALNGGFIYKINLAALTSNKNYNSGMLSFRELASAMMHVELAKPVTSGVQADAIMRHGIDYPLQRAVGAGGQPFLSAAGDPIKVTISVLARTNSIINCDGQSGRCTGLLSN